MKVELDEYSQFGERIRCTAKTEDWEYTFWWDPEVGATPVAGISNQQSSLSYSERMAAYGRAKIIHRMIYGLNQNL